MALLTCVCVCCLQERRDLLRRTTRAEDERWEHIHARTHTCTRASGLEWWKEGMDAGLARWLAVRHLCLYSRQPLGCAFFGERTQPGTSLCVLVVYFAATHGKIPRLASISRNGTRRLRS